MKENKENCFVERERQLMCFTSLHMSKKRTKRANIINSFTIAKNCTDEKKQQKKKKRKRKNGENTRISYSLKM